MKIVHIIDHWGLGGAQRAVTNLINLDKENEHIVLSLFEHNKLDWNLKSPVFFVGKTYFSMPFVILKLRSMLKRIGPDILHIHLNGSRIMEFLSTIGFRDKTPIIWHEHSGIEIFELYGRFFGRILTNIFKIIHRRVFFISNSHATSCFLQEELNVASDKLVMIPCPVDIKSLTCTLPQEEPPPEFAKPDGQPIFGFIGRLSPQKGVNLLFPIIEPLLKKYPDSQFWVIGDGPLREELLECFKGSDCWRQFVFWKIRNDVFNLLRKIDVVLMPSLYEPYGMVAKESLLLGTPVVGHAVGGLEEVLMEHALGTSVPANDFEAFRNAIVKSLSMNRNCEQIDERAFDNSDDFIKLYKNLVLP